MLLDERFQAFEALGKKLRLLPNNVLEAAEAENPWFIPAFAQQAATHIADWLKPTSLAAFCSTYLSENEPQQAKRVGVILAGNIPLVGFHDILCVLLSGHHLLVKYSSKDRVLMRFLIKCLKSVEPKFSSLITETQDLQGAQIEALIFTGSDSSLLHVQQLFPNLPKIMRGNRHSVALLDGTETDAQLQNLVADCFSYFGLGCRSIAKLLVPNQYDFKAFIACAKQFGYLIECQHYRNNFVKNKALNILNKTTFTEAGFFTLQEAHTAYSPLACLHYEYYTKATNCLQAYQNREDIQIILQKDQFGSAQKPSLEDFADGVNTLEFLNSLQTEKL